MLIIPCDCFQAVTFPLVDMVVPAPRIRRPFEELSQPFSTSCSKLCNHPLDPDKQLPAFGQDLWAGGHLEEKKTLLLPEEELVIREELERLVEEDGTPPSSLSSRHSQEDDEDKMPEESFMKYTKDSRTASPARESGEGESTEDKKQIKVDLRETEEAGVSPRRPAPRGPSIQKQRGRSVSQLVSQFNPTLNV